MTAQASGKYIWLTAVIIMLPLVLLCFRREAHGQRSKVRRVPAGVWGGEHIGIWVEQEGARIEYDCGSGTIDEPLLLDRRGRFAVKGTHYVAHGGPVRIGESLAGQPARYTGSLAGQTLTISVRLMNLPATVGTFRLQYNQEPRVVKCLSAR